MDSADNNPNLGMLNGFPVNRQALADQPLAALNA